MRRITRYMAMALLTVAAIMLMGCIKNDIPYPHIQVNFLTLEAEGQDRGCQIDSVKMVATLYFPEETNIYEVKILSYTLTDGGFVVGDALSKPLDLSSPVEVTLERYQQYRWTIVGRQPIERYFSVEGQIGSAEIDADNHTVRAFVSSDFDLSRLKVEKCKLGPLGSTSDPLLEGTYTDFSKPLEVTVDIYGHRQIWTITLTPQDAKVTTISANAWTRVAWVEGSGLAGHDNGIEYRLATSPDNPWMKVPSSWMEFDGGSFTARIPHLDPMTSYEARAYCDGEYGRTLSFTTGLEIQPPNMSLDSWWLNGKVWNPWPENGEQYWDTGNKGATTLGNSNSVPTTDTSTGSGWAAMLETRFVGIGLLGKLAAGNLFIGKYVRTEGTNGVLSFGREFTQRPTKLRGYFKYTTTNISHTTSGLESLKGRPDTCIVWCALIDQDTPFEIRTNPSNRQLFDSEAPTVIAYGKMECGQTVENYVPFEFTLDYKYVDRVPKFLLITASASKYGDYFTGGNGSVLYLDDLELLYDY